MNTKNMPAGLAAYWKKHKRTKAHKKKSVKKTSQRVSRQRAKRGSHVLSVRRVNPVAVFRLAIQKGNNKASRLYLSRDAEEFSVKTISRKFHSVEDVKRVALPLIKKYSSNVLKGYSFLVVPIGTR